jgi:hypothetical protein
MANETNKLLNEGDEVACCYMGKLQSIAKVARVTATQALLTNGTRLKRTEGAGWLDEVGAEKWNHRAFYFATDEHRKELALRDARAKVMAAIDALRSAVATGGVAYVEQVATLFQPNPLKKP